MFEVKNSAFVIKNNDFVLLSEKEQIEQKAFEVLRLHKSTYDIRNKMGIDWQKFFMESNKKHALNELKNIIIEKLSTFLENVEIINIECIDRKIKFEIIGKYNNEIIEIKGDF